MSYTDTASEADFQTITQSGMETLADELSYAPSQTASFTITTSNAVDDSDYESGTETLGGGGSITGGSASVSWSDDATTGRTLNTSGVATTLNIHESSTDSDGFAESGTESIMSGGADASGSMNFNWDQLGTDNYAITQANSASEVVSGLSTSASYLLTLADSVSSSWDDEGTESLSDDARLAAQTDSYTWTDFHSLSYALAEAVSTSYYDPPSGSVPTITSTLVCTGSGTQSFSLADDGGDTLAADASDSGSLTLVGGSDSYTMGDALTDS